MLPFSWNYFYTNAISVPVEITAAGLLLTFWDANVRIIGMLHTIWETDCDLPRLPLGGVSSLTIKLRTPLPFASAHALSTSSV